jgi:hypothetical protein
VPQYGENELPSPWEVTSQKKSFFPGYTLSINGLMQDLIWELMKNLSCA